MPEPITVTLSDGRAVELQPPTAGQLRGVKLLDVLQMDTAAHALIADRVSTLTAAEFHALPIGDAMEVMTKLMDFLQPTAAFPTASKTPMP